MNWLERHRKNIEEMKMTETVVTVSSDKIGIYRYMFRGNKEIKEIRLPKTIQYIEKTSFRNCTSLEKINLPAQVYYIHEETFKGCVSLKEIIAEKSEPPKCIISNVGNTVGNINALQRRTMTKCPNSLKTYLRIKLSSPKIW